MAVRLDCRPPQISLFPHFLNYPVERLYLFTMGNSFDRPQNCPDLICSLFKAFFPSVISHENWHFNVKSFFFLLMLASNWTCLMSSNFPHALVTVQQLDIIITSLFLSLDAIFLVWSNFLSFSITFKVHILTHWLGLTRIDPGLGQTTNNILCSPKTPQHLSVVRLCFPRSDEVCFYAKCSC